MSDDMLSQEPSAVAGIGVLKLLCKEKHCVARLIKPAGHQPTYIHVPGKAQEEWPREEDNKRTACILLGLWECGSHRFRFSWPEHERSSSTPIAA